MLLDPHLHEQERRTHHCAVNRSPPVCPSCVPDIARFPPVQANGPQLFWAQLMKGLTEGHLVFGRIRLPTYLIKEFGEDEIYEKLR